MLANTLVVLTVLAAVGAGVVGGILFAFSTAVMTALRRLPPPHGMAAMQQVNVLILNWQFLGLFLGTAVACALLLLACVLGAGGAPRPWLAGGALLYLVGTVGITMVCNVPLNDRLAALDPAAPQAAPLWQSYVAGWVRWNHLRSALSMLSALAFAVALVPA